MHSGSHYHTAQLLIDFSYWKHLHGFWHTMPNFNPHTQSAGHGKDLAAQAQELLVGHKSKERGHINTKEEVDEGEDIDPSNHSRPASPDALDPVPANPGASCIMPTTLPVSSVALHLFGNDPCWPSLVLSENQQSSWSISQSVSWSVSWRYMSSWGRLHGSVVYSTSSSSSFANAGDDNKMMFSYAMMATNKLDQQIAKQSAKCAKYESKKLKQQEPLLVLQMQHEWESQVVG
jgi:hypothetical protein